VLVKEERQQALEAQLATAERAAALGRSFERFVSSSAATTSPGR